MGEPMDEKKAVDDNEKSNLVNGIRVAAGWTSKLIEAQEQTHFEILGKSYKRIPYGNEALNWRADEFSCHDCCAVKGQYHVAGCDVEECPKCGGQSIGCECSDEESSDDGKFSFDKHKSAAVAEYLKARPHYEQLCEVARLILKEALSRKAIKIQSIEGRAKTAESFGRKAAKPSEIEPQKPKYINPLEDIKDLAGVRVVAFFPGSLNEIDNVIAQEFEILERSDKGERLIVEGQFGYNSVHYLVSFSKNRAALPEYERFSQSILEIQVRTVLQHAWAEIEHDIQYKSTSVIPLEIRRRFMSLAGVLEIADREFQAIQDEDNRLRENARSLIRKGELDEVEITPDALKSFLSRRIGADRRISWDSYDFLARSLRGMGFRNLGQLEKCTRDLDGDYLSRVVFDTRQGQVYRFELMLMVAMGDIFLERHPFTKYDWFHRFRRGIINLMVAKGIVIGSYDPRKED